MNDLRQKPARLTRSADFDRVYRQGRSVQRRHLVVYVFERPDADASEHPRVGLTVSKKVGTATERNRLKRQLKDAIARHALELPGHDVVVIARPGLPDAVESQGFSWLEQELHELLGEAEERLRRRRPRGA